MKNTSEGIHPGFETYGRQHQNRSSSSITGPAISTLKPNFLDRSNEYLGVKVALRFSCVKHRESFRVELVLFMTMNHLLWLWITYSLRTDKTTGTEIIVANPHLGMSLGNVNFQMWRNVRWLIMHHRQHSARGRNDPERLFPYSWLKGFSGIIPVKVMERLGNMRPAALWIAL